MITPIQIIKGYHALEGSLTQELSSQISNLLGLSQNDIRKRLWGKDNEIEFFIMVHFLNNCKIILGFEESFSKISNTPSCDFFIVTNQGLRMVVEVKSTTKQCFSISKKLLKEKEEFAQLMNAELYFAIKIVNTWMYISGHEIEKNNRKTSLNSNESQLNKIFGNRVFLIINGLRFICTYQKGQEPCLLKEHLTFGSLISYKIMLEDKEILSISSLDDLNAKFIFLFCFLENLAFDQRNIITVIDQNTTLVECELIEYKGISLWDMLNAFIESMMNEDKSNVTPNIFFSDVLRFGSNPFKKDDFVEGLKYLSNNGFPVLEFIDDDNLQLLC